MCSKASTEIGLKIGVSFALLVIAEKSYLIKQIATLLSRQPIDNIDVIRVRFKRMRKFVVHARRDFGFVTPLVQP
jgi:hypothetical protein